jgi:hypothetical protein
MTATEARAFAEQWARNWNARNVEAVLAHFAEDVVFSSPVALTVTGKASVVGKSALRAYWRRALDGHPALSFEVQRTLWDQETGELAIIYDREINERHDRAAEVLTFGAGDLIVRGEAFYGVIPR